MDILDRTILNIFNLPFLDIISPVNIPNNLFGVFVTIHRHNKLKNYPYDIHGCIGYWDDNYKTVSSKLIYDKIMTVSKDAMYNDNRREYFPPIETDPLSTIEINYMQQPLYKIDPDTGLIPELGTYFNNNKYGLIVHHSNGNKATYLPKVFEKINWNGIKKSISSKAGININNKIRIKINKTKNIINQVVRFILFKLSKKPEPSPDEEAIELLTSLDCNSELDKLFELSIIIKIYILFFIINAHII